MRKKYGRQKAYYFTDRLSKQLAQIPLHPLTVVEAPSGFGKTTAVREYLRENLPSGACEYWYTCLGEPAAVAWRGICELLSNVNGEIAANLRKLEVPAVDTLMYMTGILRDFQCQAETYLVIDNYQLVSSDIPRELMSVFSMHGSPNLHMVFITQQLGPRQKFTVHNDNIYTIDSSAFFFDREGTASLFLMEGIRLSESELESVFTGTEGWVSAIRLQILSFEESGSFDYTADIERLVEIAIWDRLTPEEKEFLLSVSVMDHFTARQAAIMLGRETLPGAIEELLSTNDFIRYFPQKGLYTIHGILQDYLRNRFYHHQPEEFQKRVLHLAGRSFAAVSQYYLAGRFFLKVGDFDALLSLPFSVEYLDGQRENGLLEFAAAVAGECPEETLCKYPFAMLIFAYPLWLGGQTELFEKLRRLIASAAGRDTGFSREELRSVRGELALMTSFTAYNDIKKMHEGRKAALAILGGPSSVLANDTMPWTFGSTSVLFMFWRESGGLENELREMEESLPCYRRLTRGHGTGADSVMRAEAMLMRGEDDAAEMLCHRALYAARSCQQTGICICAELTLARVAILRGDAEGYFTAVNNIKSHAKESPKPCIVRMVELALAAVSVVLGTTDAVAKWLCDAESMKKALYAPAVPYAQIVYAHLLLQGKRYNEFFGISQLIIDTAKGMHYLLSQIYQLLFLAAAKYRTGEEGEAREYLAQALAIALPDRVYLPFAQQADTLGALLESAKRSVSDQEGVNAVIALGKRQGKGASIIKKAVLQAESPLTPREREVARLARDRLSAKEIAERLYISEATVRTILKSVYSKLDIHSKTELNFKEF